MKLIYTDTGEDVKPGDVVNWCGYTLQVVNFTRDGKVNCTCLKGPWWISGTNIYSIETLGMRWAE